MYDWKIKIRYSECGADDCLKMSAAVDLLQDIATFQSESLGIGVDYLKERKRAWYLSTWQIAAESYPKAADEVVISTWAAGFKGVFGPRDFTVRTPEGQTLMLAHSLWVYMDTEKGIPVKPDKREADLYGDEPGVTLPYAPRKIDVPDEGETVFETDVMRSHIDTNGHMNNSAYVRMASEILPDGFKIRQMRAEYKKPAMYGERITVKRSLAPGKVFARLCAADGQVYAILEFAGE